MYTKNIIYDNIMSIKKERKDGKMKRIVASLLILFIMISLLPTHIFAATPTKFTITPDKTEVHPGDTITYTVKMSAVQKIAGMKFELNIPEGLTFIEGKEADGLVQTLHAAKAEFTTSTKVFVVGSSNYTSTADTTLMTFKCSVNEGTKGNKEVTFIIDDEENFFDTSYNNIDIEYSNPGSTVKITIPSTGITLNKTKLSLEKGKSETLTATVTPENSTDTITWESSDKTKATVDNNGKVTAVAEGTATITAKTTSGKTATCTVTVTKPICKHTNKTTIAAKAATCTEKGNNEYKVCDDCGKVFKADGVTETTVEAEKTKALGHDFSIPRANETQHWNECSRCGIADTKINHVGEGDYGKDSTKHWKVCGCGTKVDEEEHKASAPVKENEKPATCTADGSHDEVVYCSVCGYKMSSTNKVDKATGHTAGEPVKENEKAATCTTEGTYDEVIYCKVCNTKISSTPKTTPATGHTPGEPVRENIVPATHTTKGSYNEVIYCKVCNAKISTTQKEIPMIPHDVTDVAWSSDETNHWKECGCGTKVDVSAHIAGEPVKENIVPATCTTDGSHDEVIYCSVCKKEMSRTKKTDKAIGHTEGEKVKENIVPATCTKDGSHDEVVKCKTCGTEISRTKKTDKATGHTAGEAVKEDEVPATCTAEGKYNEVVYCKTCNAKISSTPKTIPAKGHTEGAVTIENEIEATVDKEGSYEEVIYCSDCNKELSRTKKTTPKFVYEILEGAGSSHEEETSDTITIKANGKFEKFKGIKVDGKDVDKKYYTAKSGSTIVTLSADYLNTIAVGEHKIAFVYDDGEVETTFKVAEKNNTDTSNNTQDNNKNNPSTPKTGDESNMTLWIVGLTISGILFVIILGCKSKGTRRKSRH